MIDALEIRMRWGNVGMGESAVGHLLGEALETLEQIIDQYHLGIWNATLGQQHVLGLGLALIALLAVPQRRESTSKSRLGHWLCLTFFVVLILNSLLSWLLCRRLEQNAACRRFLVSRHRESLKIVLDARE